jgi:hypothetical protein
MNPLLLFGGLAAVRKSVGETVHRTALGLVAYALLLCCGLIAGGFFTAGCFLYLTETWGAVTASMIVAAAYAIAGSIGFLAIRMVRKRHPAPVVQPLSTPALDIPAATAGRDIPGGIISVGLLAAAGYFMGRSMGRKP